MSKQGSVCLKMYIESTKLLRNFMFIVDSMIFNDNFRLFSS